MRKAQAAHNEQLCNLLLNNGTFNDWVVTSAFYSALHKVQHELFPLKLGTVTYDNFEAYYSKIIQRKQSKHKTMIALCGSNLNGAHPSYKWLHDACHGARYNNYIVSHAIALRAKTELTAINTICKK